MLSKLSRLAEGCEQHSAQQCVCERFGGEGKDEECWQFLLDVGGGQGESSGQSWALGALAFRQCCHNKARSIV